MDNKGRESGHLMLITPERVFYAGLLGRPRQRCSGALHVYVAIKGGIRLAAEGAVEGYSELAVVPPNLRHTVASDYRSVICVLVEPETVCAGALDLLAKRLAGVERPFFAARIRAACEQLRRQPCDGDIFSSAFDVMCFGDALPRRILDARVVQAIAQIGRFSGDPVTAASCAAEGVHQKGDLMKTFQAFVSRLSRFLGVIAGGTLLFVMVLTVLDVILRYFGYPIVGV